MTTATQQDISLLNINLSNARSENESYEEYRARLKRNREILNTYFTFGREKFREMFPAGVGAAVEETLKQADSPDAPALEVPMVTEELSQATAGAKSGGFVYKLNREDDK